MTATAPLIEQVRGLVRLAGEAYAADADASRQLEAALARLDEPPRVAIAGKVKSGKSTLLNALVGQELAPTDAGECTKIVTWYRDGVTYRATLDPRDGAPRQAAFSRDGGPVDVDLGGLTADQVERLIIDWPSPSLKTMTLIDTPGIASLSKDVSARTVAFLNREDDSPAEADAVIYLMKHLHSTDVAFLEAFRDDETARATPVNAIGILSRADEAGAGRLDAMNSAARIANRYRQDPNVRRLCQTVVPVAGLIAQTGSTLREDEFRALAVIAEAPSEEAGELLLSADRFALSETPLLPALERKLLLDRFGLFGVRLAIALIREKKVVTSTDLARALVQHSGLEQLRSILLSQFAARGDLLKCRSALQLVEALLRRTPSGGSEPVASELERITAGAHEFAELRLLNALRATPIGLSQDESEEAERLLGALGIGDPERLGRDPSATGEELAAAARAAMERWQRRAENPMSPLEVAEAARLLTRTCEGILARLSQSRTG